MDLEALVTDELRSEGISGFSLDWFESASRHRSTSPLRVWADEHRP
jgi:hypothetical protein